ncbi:MAG TPA: hypothetical protein ENK52_01865 [Saprospiraceae bacterium]|nr:hypothetical protein [Saprospiraceae bacterium]
MQNVLIFFIFGLVVAMLFLNLYFRMKVLKAYKKLVQNKVELKTRQIFNKVIMEKEVYSRYPQHRADIESFIHYMQYSIKMATVLIALISLLGGVLMYFRHDY